MTPDDFLRVVLVPGMKWLEQIVGPVPPPSREARLLLLAIAGQESNWSTRVQGGPIPAAHSYWQFERNGGVRGVLDHPASKEAALKVCLAASVSQTPTDVWTFMGTPEGDELSTAFARLLLFTDQRRLPAYGDENAAWIYYDNNWRPGRPSRERWADVYPEALQADKEWADRTPANPIASLSERRFQAALAVYAAIDFDKVDDDAEIVRRVLAAADGVT